MDGAHQIVHRLLPLLEVDEADCWNSPSLVCASVEERLVVLPQRFGRERGEGVPGDAGRASSQTIKPPAAAPMTRPSSSVEMFIRFPVSGRGCYGRYRPATLSRAGANPCGSLAGEQFLIRIQSHTRRHHGQPGSLWLPILVSAVLVFVVSAIIHMVLKYHNRDYTPLPNEDAVRSRHPGGQSSAGAVHHSLLPRHEGHGKAGDEAEVRRGSSRSDQPHAPGTPNMGKSLGQWFVFISVVSFFIAYVAAHTIPAGAAYLHVFRVVGAVGFLAYAAGQVPELDLDGKALEGDVQGRVRWARLWAGDGGYVRLAVAEVRGQAGKRAGRAGGRTEGR